MSAPARTTAIAALLTLAALGAAACGGSSQSASTGSATSTTRSRSASATSGHATARAVTLSPAIKEGFVKYAACMREHGVSMPEPNVNGPGPVFDPKQIDTSSPNFQSASKTCRSKLQALIDSNRTTATKSG